MNHDDHVALLRGGIDQPGGVWADVGSGTGAFTLALADLIGETRLMQHGLQAPAGYRSSGSTWDRSVFSQK